jgi:N-acyl-L-homoserine lactone synthetase
MKMIHAVTLANQHLYARQLDQMFRMRHAYYIEGHGWSGLTSTDGRETDEFDDDGVVYLMSVDPFGDVAASVRLNPTEGPTLLKKFAHWSDEALPELESVWDISRWIAAPHHRRATNPRWPSNHQRELMVGILEFCLSRGLTHLTMLAEHRLAERIGAYGWPLRFLGAPRIYEGGKGTAVAAEIEVGQHVLAMTRAKTGVLGTMLVEVGANDVSAGASRPVAPAELQGLVESLGASRIQTLINILASAIVDTADRPRSIELVGAIARLFEAAGFATDNEANAKWKQPGLSTGLSLQFGTTDRA